MPEPGRLRRIPHQFSWIDHRLVRHGHLRHCGDAPALALYLFLVTVGDSQGLSYYSQRRLIEHLPLSEAQLRGARRRLIDTGLIAYRKPFYQVLGLDDMDVVENIMPAAEASANTSSERPAQPHTTAHCSAAEEDQCHENPAIIREALRETLKMLKRGSKEAEQNQNT